MTEYEARSWATRVAGRILQSAPARTHAQNIATAQGIDKGDWPLVAAEIDRIAQDLRGNDNDEIGTKSR